jgi:hypothetical protein
VQAYRGFESLPLRHRSKTIAQKPFKIRGLSNGRKVTAEHKRNPWRDFFGPEKFKP